MSIDLLVTIKQEQYLFYDIADVIDYISEALEREGIADYTISDINIDNSKLYTKSQLLMDMVTKDGAVIDIKLSKVSPESLKGMPRFEEDLT